MEVGFLYFDMGNVLLSFSHEQMFRQMAELAGVDAQFVRHIFTEPAGDSLQLQFETGLIEPVALYERFCRATSTRPDREALFLAASDMFAELPATVALVRRLRAAGNRLGVLSNTNANDWQFVTSGRFPFLQECFDQYALSFEARAMKPDRAIYQYAVEKSGVPTNEVFFVDDRQENVAGALAAGLDAVLFTEVDALERDLRKRGVAGA